MHNKPTFEGWAIVELLGHRVLAGMAREVEICGTRMLRLDVALPGSIAVPQFYPPTSIYGITLATAEQVEVRQTRNEDELWGYGLLPPDLMARREARLAQARYGYEVRRQADLDEETLADADAREDDRGEWTDL